MNGDTPASPVIMTSITGLTIVLLLRKYAAMGRAIYSVLPNRNTFLKTVMDKLG